MYQLLLLTLLSVTSISLASNHVPLPTTTKLREDDHDSLFCESWRFSIETNNAGNWSSIPSRCYEYVLDYMSGDRYVLDTKFTARNALEFAKTVNMAGDGKDAWIFDVDETLLSHVPYFKTYRFGLGAPPSKELQKWLLLAKAPPVQASLNLYKKLQQLRFTIFILTGRPESLRNVTTEILSHAGYSNWERLILREPSDTRLAIDYKSERRKQLEDEGYRIHGNCGDQWSDLLGYSIAHRSFKVPNPMYYVA